MSNILFISPYYPPESGAAPACVGETATRLVKQGHQVTVLTTFPNYPTGMFPKEYRGRVLQQEMRDGVHVVRVWSWVTPNKSFLHRIKWYLSFAFLAPLIGGKAIGHPEVIIVQSPPLFDAIAVRMLARWKRCPYIFMVSDLWPEQAIQLGVLRNRLLIWLSERLEWSTYRKAALVWAVTEWIRDRLIQRGLAPEQILLLTNGVDTTKFHPLPQAQARIELGWDDRFTILYVGTHGVTHGLMTIIDAAEQLRDHNRIHFILVGEGSDKDEMVEHAQKLGLTNITFMDVVPYSLVPTILAAGDVCLAHVHKASITERILPIKMFEAMAYDHPIVLAVDGEARRIAEQEAGAAIFVEPENAAALASAILDLYKHPELAAALGSRGRAYVETRYDYDHLTEVLDARIAQLLDEHKSRNSHSRQKYAYRSPTLDILKQMHSSERSVVEDESGAKC